MSGLLGTAGNVLFSGDGIERQPRCAERHDGGAAVARRCVASVSNGPITFEMDGLQYVMVGAGDTLWSFVMRE